MLLCLQHSFGDPEIGAAAAKIAAHALSDTFGIAARLAFLDEADRTHDLAWRAEAALKAIMLDEGRLNRVQLLAARYAFDREDRAPSWLSANAMQELTRRPSTRTVQAPHCPRSHPFFVPVKLSRSRKRSSNVMRGSVSSISRCSPLMMKLVEKFMR
jgi:hypothetical protein